MPLVKALAVARFPISSTEDADWAVGETRRIPTYLLARYQAHSDVFTVLDATDNDATAETAVESQLATATAGAKNGSTVTATETEGIVHKTVLTLTATPITITDDAGVAQYGGAGKIYDFPEGLIAVLGATIDGAVTLGDTGTITTTWAGGIALGTAAATTGATLTGTEANIMAEVDVAAATASVAACDAVSSTNVAPLNGTVTPVDCYLNLVVDDHASHTSGTGTFTGTVTIHWINLGDNA